MTDWLQDIERKINEALSGAPEAIGVYKPPGAAEMFGKNDGTTYSRGIRGFFERAVHTLFGADTLKIFEKTGYRITVCRKDGPDEAPVLRV